MDRFQAEAYALISGPAARTAFDINREDSRLRDRYGRHTWGQSCLLARRLVEAGELEALAARLEGDKEVPAKVMTERAFLESQTQALSFVLLNLGGFLGVIMGAAAILTAMNTMLAAVSARTHEIGVLLAMGYRPLPVFLSFQFEALLLGLMGGGLGCVLALFFNGIETGTMNFQTFTEFAFAFRVTPFVLIVSVVFATALGMLGGAWPAWRAARMKPTTALQHR
jgi:putative ABC transport system permease protein